MFNRASVSFFDADTRAPFLAMLVISDDGNQELHVVESLATS